MLVFSSFFFLIIRRPPRSTLFPTRRSSDLVFGESSRAAVISAGNAKHLAAVAKIDFAAGTIRAGTARNRRIERDAIAFGPTRDLRAKGGDAASRFVAHHDGRDTTAGGSAVAVDVAAAAAAGPHVHPQFAATGTTCPTLGTFHTPPLATTPRLPTHVSRLP